MRERTPLPRHWSSQKNYVLSKDLSGVVLFFKFCIRAFQMFEIGRKYLRVIACFDIGIEVSNKVSDTAGPYVA